MNPKKSGARKRTRWIALAVLGAAAAAGYYGWQNSATRGKTVEYRSVLVVRGPITASVSASGTLTPVISVPVSSQVSGQVKEVLVDYNSEVRQGQLIARIDPETFEYRVRQAQADLEATNAQVLTAQANVSAARAAVSRAEVNLAEARRDLDRKQQLVERGYISPAEIDRARATVNTVAEDLKGATAQVAVTEAQARAAQATVKQRAAQLAQADVDLRRTQIRAPVDGVVIKKSIDAGQTVAASLQAPEMFVIARDLRDMQVDTSVDESEIGRVRLGQRASFTIDSFPGRSFNGEVRQIRKAAVTVQNVVTYTVVVSAQNADLSLVPGMTANVRIVTDSRESALKVPNAALRFRPPDFQEPPPARSGADELLRSAAGTLAALLPAAHAQQPGGALAQFRERLERDLALSDAQKKQFDTIFATMRERFSAAREAPDAERPALIERNRAELREKIGQTLNPEQKKKYAEILAEIAARQASGSTAGAPGGATDASRSQAAAAPAAGSGGAPGAPTNAQKSSAASSPASAAAPAKATAASPAASVSASASSSAPAAAGPGGALRQFRERLERDLAMDEAQRQQLDAIFAGMREKFIAVREAPEGERAKLTERNRAELRQRIGDILNPEQKKKYAEILAEISNRQSTRGRVFVLDEQGKPKAVPVRLGLTDGSFTEVIGEEIKEGDRVIVGTVGAAPGAPKSAPGQGAPRLPF